MFLKRKDTYFILNKQESVKYIILNYVKHLLKLKTRKNRYFDRKPEKMNSCLTLVRSLFKISFLSSIQCL